MSAEVPASASDPSPAEVKAVVNALLRLGTGRGFDVVKGRQRGPLRELGYRKANPTARDDVVADGLRIALEAGCDRLGQRGVVVGGSRQDGYPADVIASGVLGIASLAGLKLSLLDRRQLVAERLDLISGTTVFKWQTQAFEQLAQVLFEFRDDPVALSPDLEPAIQTVFQRASHRPTAIKIRQRAHFKFGATGTITEHTNEITLKCVGESTSSYVFWHEYFDDHKPGVFVTESVERCILSRQADAGGAYFVEFNLAPPLTMGQTRTIKYRLAVRSKVRSAARIRLTAIESEGERPSVISLQFDETFRPQEVWWFVEVGLGGGEYLPQANQMLDVEPSGYVEYRFPPTHRGENYGIAWQWPDGGVK